MYPESSYTPFFKMNRIQEDFSTEALSGVIKNVVSILQKRLGTRFYPGKLPVYVNKQGEGTVQGLMLYAGTKAIRLNWKVGEVSSNVVSVDFWKRPGVQPDLTIKTEGENIVQLLDLITQTFETGKPSEIEVIQEVRAKKGTAINWIKGWIKGGQVKLKAIAGMKMGYIYQEFQKWSKENVGGWYESAISLQTFRNNMLSVFEDAGVEYKLAKRVRAEKAPKEILIINKKDEQTFEKTKDDATRLSPKQKFAKIEAYLKHLAAGRTKLVIIVGDPGIGKSVAVEDILSSIGKPFVTVKGSMTAAGLYEYMYDHNGEIIVFDDIDSILENDVSGNYLKAAFDTSKKRIISKIGAKRKKTKDDDGGDEKAPSQYEFTGQGVMISNLYIRDFEPALISRGALVELNLTAEEMVERIRDLIDVLPPGDIDHETKIKTLEFILSISKEWKKLDFRTFSLCVLDASSGDPDWKKFVRDTIMTKAQSVR